MIFPSSAIYIGSRAFYCLNHVFINVDNKITISSLAEMRHSENSVLVMLFKTHLGNL